MGRDADARVFDADSTLLPFERNETTIVRLRRKLDGVAHQVVEHLLEVVAICSDRPIRRTVEIDLDRVLRRRQLKSSDNVASQLPQVHRRPIKLELARLDLRNVE